MRIYRIADKRHPIWDGTGAALLGGRWNSPGHPAIYGSLSHACAMLEILAHAGIGRIPAMQQFVTAELPDDASLVERHEASALPDGWDGEDSRVARRFGDAWLGSRRSLVLVVPSVVARLEFNAVVNPAHPDFSTLKMSAPEPVVWDRRLFR
ncbi:RES family NAD+ phosphorylase [Thauera butanivorans]|uniref:RES family NAD+ phosphorylase n=1 Tax=Thauera butanivorans TaxID=86174 RepID=UPI003AB5E80D